MHLYEAKKVSGPKRRCYGSAGLKKGSGQTAEGPADSLGIFSGREVPALFGRENTVSCPFRDGRGAGVPARGVAVAKIAGGWVRGISVAQEMPARNWQARTRPAPLQPINMEWIALNSMVPASMTG